MGLRVGFAANHEGLLRYTSPSLEISTPSGLHITLPGFQALDSYIAAFTNLEPELQQREISDSVEEVLAFADWELATQEVAVMLGLDREAARAKPEGVATERPLGTDSYWSLPGGVS